MQKENKNDMSLFDTDEMKVLIDKVRPYLNERLELPDDAPEEIKFALEEYRRLGREQEEFALSL